MERPAPESNNECCVLVVCASVEEEEEDERKLQDENIQFLQITPTTIQVQFPGIFFSSFLKLFDFVKIFLFFKFLFF